jgi:mycothiol synthase
MQITIRNYREGDLEALVALINAADAVDKLERGTSLQEMREEFGSPNFFPEKDVFIAEEGGRIVGYTCFWLRKGEEESIFDAWGVVHPAWRRKGIGRRLLERLYQRARERLEEVKSPKVYFDCGCESGEKDRIALYEGFGMRRVRCWLEMVYEPLNSIPELEFPPEFALRTFVKGQDEEAWLSTLNEAFRDHWGHVDQTLEECLYWVGLPRFRQELSLIATIGDEIVGLCHCEVNEDEIARIGRKEGWVNILAVRRPYRRRGLGKALLIAGMLSLRKEGMEAIVLGVDAENPTGARHLYEKVGFVERRRYLTYRKEVI